jgi:hypothetical protein
LEAPSVITRGTRSKDPVRTWKKLFRPFLWVPSDATPDRKARTIELEIKKWLEERLSPWSIWIPNAGWIWFDKETSETHVGNGKLEIRCFGPISGIPVGHAYYKEGHDTYVIRYPDRSFLKLYVDEIPGHNKLELPDDVAHRLAARGVLKVESYDDPDYREPEFELEDIKAQQYRRRPGDPEDADDFERHVMEEREALGLPLEPTIQSTALSSEGAEELDLLEDIKEHNGVISQ